MSVEMSELKDSVRRVMVDSGLDASADSIWSQIVDLGWLMVAVPEELGGLGAGVEGACAMHLELGRGLCKAPYMPAMLTLDAICQSELASKEEWLERIFGGEFISVALAQSDVRNFENGLGGTLSGVLSADSASHLLVWTNDLEHVVLVKMDQPGIELVAKNTWDETRKLFDVQISDLALSNQVSLATGPVAAKLVQRLQGQANLALAADALGGASALLEQTVEHLQTRVQFKRPLAMFQALKHRCADMKANIVAAQAMLFDSISTMQEGALVAKANKMLSCDVFADTAEDCLQLHGGIGMADEHPCHLFLKRSLLNVHLSGKSDSYASEIGSRLISLAK